MPSTTGIITTASGRTLEEVKAGIKIRMRNMVNSALEIGLDLMEAKEACKHGEWMTFLRETGISASTAANYMRIAKEVSADSRMAALPYTKILALLAAPPEDREELADAAEDMSAAEIRRLTEERNRAAEAANTETARADQAEEDAKRFYDENARLRTEIQQKDGLADNLHKRCVELENEAGRLRGKLIEAENNRVEVEVIKAPEDYERIKAQLAAAEKSAKDLIDAAADAEERASAAEAELEELRAENAQSNVSDYEKMHLAMKTFLFQCELMACKPQGLYRDSERVKRDVSRLRQWCDAMDDAMRIHVIEGAVV